MPFTGTPPQNLIMKRADSRKQNMGLNTWKTAPSGKIIKTDVSIAKNYLSEKELKTLNRFVTMYLDYAESQAEKNIPMTMNDWATKLNAFLQFNEKEILSSAGKVTQAIAKAFAESEFEKYRIVQDKLFESDFDKVVKKALAPSKPADKDGLRIEIKTPQPCNPSTPALTPVITASASTSSSTSPKPAINPK